MEKVFVYAEYQVSMPFTKIDWLTINQQMLTFKGLKSKTWLSGINTNSVGGFYEFDSKENAQSYINNLLIPFASQINGNLSIKMFDGNVVAEASAGMHSPFYEVSRTSF